MGYSGIVRRISRATATLTRRQPPRFRLAASAIFGSTMLAIAFHRLRRLVASAIAGRASAAAGLLRGRAVTEHAAGASRPTAALLRIRDLTESPIGKTAFSASVKRFSAKSFSDGTLCTFSDGSTCQYPT